jgi:hypothetical protein
MAVQDNASQAYLARVEKSFRRDYDGELPAPLVVPSSDATWLEPQRPKVCRRMHSQQISGAWC